MIEEQHDPETGELPSTLPAETTSQHIARDIREGRFPQKSEPLPLTPYDKIAAAVAEVMKEIAEDPVEKRGENTFHHYNFARMQDINQALTPLMAKHGLAISQSEVERSFLDNGSTVYATYEFTVLHSSGQRWPTTLKQTGMSRVRDSKGGFDDKALNKCHTSARKFFLTAFFQIPTKDDDEDVRRYRPQTNQARTKINGNDTQPQPLAAAPAQQPNNPYQLKNTKGETYLGYGERLLAEIFSSKDIAQVDEWVRLNTSVLDLMKKNKPDIHTNVMHSIKQHRGTLAMTQIEK
jgi:hypothetical protein